MADTEQKREVALDDLREALAEFLAAQRRLRGREATRKGELSFSQYRLLRAVAEADACSAGELAAAADLTPASTTRMVDHLTAHGVVERVRSESDRRMVTIRLTAEGRRRYEAKAADLRRAYEDVLADMPPRELRQAARVLRRLGKLLDGF